MSNTAYATIMSEKEFEESFLELSGRVDIDFEVSEIQATGVFILNPNLGQLSCLSGYFLREDCVK